DTWSDQIAQRLLALGIRREEHVALCLERSPALVAAVFGILKAGGAYVPLDPEYPPARLSAIAQDAGVRLLVTDRAGQSRASEAFAGLEAIVVSELSSERPAPVLERPHPDQLAYIIYTSGSTGKPKGVGVTHANLARLFDATAAEFDFGPEDVWTLFHSAAFDFSVWELFGALLHGGRLVVVPQGVARDPLAFHALLRAEQVSVLNQTPS